jgi:hypothetical protein
MQILRILALTASGLAASAGRPLQATPVSHVLSQSSVSWHVEVGFECKDGTCYFTGTAGFATTEIDARQQIERAIEAMIKQELRKGAKPTGSVTAAVNGKKVK